MVQSGWVTHSPFWTVDVNKASVFNPGSDLSSSSRPAATKKLIVHAQQFIHFGEELYLLRTTSENAAYDLKIQNLVRKNTFFL